MSRLVELVKKTHGKCAGIVEELRTRATIAYNAVRQRASDVANKLVGDCCG